MRKIIKLTVLIAALCCSSWSFAAQYTYYPKNSIKKLFEQAIADNAFPGGCIVAGTAHQIFISKCFGYHTYAKKQLDTTNSLFDLASLTKVIATTSAVMKLYEQGKLNLNDKIVNYLPEFQGSDPLRAKLRAEITIKDLLAHASGLPDAEINAEQDIYTIPLVTYPRQYEIYSDINFLLLGKIVEKISGMSLHQYTHNFIFKPLGMDSTFFKPDKNFLPRIIPTTFNFSKDDYLVGEVNDYSAEQLGGIAGNAGLFSDARDLTIFAQMMLNNGVYNHTRIFKPSTIHLFTTRANIVFNSSRALGWDTAFNPYLPLAVRTLLNCNAQSCFTIDSQFTAGQYINSDAFGHTGYTGTSLWISPQAGIFVLLLTNRVSPYICDARLNIEKYWRQRINSAIWENLGFTKKNNLAAIPEPVATNTLSECP